MARITIELNDLRCIKTSTGPGKDEVYILTFLGDPITRTMLGAEVSVVFNMDDGDHTGKQTLLDITRPAPDGLQWILLFMEQDFTGLDSRTLRLAMSVSSEYLKEVEDARTQIGEPPILTDRWLQWHLDAAVRALNDIIEGSAKDDRLGRANGRMVPPRLGVNGPHSISCTDHGSNYQGEYTLRLA